MQRLVSREALLPLGKKAHSSLRSEPSPSVLSLPCCFTKPFRICGAAGGERFEGQYSWDSAQPRGKCVTASCLEKHMVKKTQPKCLPAAGIVQPSGTTVREGKAREEVAACG